MSSVLLIRAEAQEPVATLTRVDGEVAVVSKSSGREVEARQVGPRVRNGSVQGGDTVRTGAGANAVLAFEDGTELELQEQTEIDVRAIDLADLAASGRRAKPIVRRVAIHGGEIAGRVVDNSQVSIEIESDSGMASIDSGSVSLAVGLGSAQVRCDEGEARFRSPATGLTLSLSAGYGFELKRTNDDRWQVEIDDGNPGPLPIALANGRRLGAVPGTRMTARLDGYAVELTVDRGQALTDADG
ncbi:MAG: FecR domain-containing protein [bacterium]|nr:FecR domain-containing protein [bacterium]